MTAQKFVETHRADWQRLDELVSKTQKNRLASLSDDELLELGALYRRATADLARAQTRHHQTHAGRELIRSLNALVLRAHAQVYSSPAPQPRRALHWISYGFPATFRRQWKPIAVAAALLLVPALVAQLCVIVNADLAPLFVPESAIREVQKRAQEKIITGWGANTSYEGVLSSPGVSSFVMTNNIQVSIVAAAMGLTAGVGTVWALVSNGLMLGGLAGVATNADVDLLFWAVILPHGALELPAIAIAGGAGLGLARAIYAPGELPRADALKLAGIEAAKLMIGVAVLLVIAGIIEGYITPLPVSPFLKLAFSALAAIALAFYLSLKPKAV